MAGGLNPGGGSRRGRGRRKAALMTEINVTPFVDVMLVLLIIFMVTAPMLTAGVPLDLPEAKGNQLESLNKEPIVVSVNKEGKLFVGQEEKDALKLEELGERLKAMAANRGGVEEPIFVRGDKQALHGIMTDVLDRIKQSGFKKVNFVIESKQGG
jgi:biopolymer transport protein TolR